jgi:hypothetical protein
MITSPRDGETIFPSASVTLAANVRPTGHDPVQVTWRTGGRTIGTGNPLTTRLTPADTAVTATATDTRTGTTSQAQVTINISTGLF